MAILSHLDGLADEDRGVDSPVHVSSPQNPASLVLLTYVPIQREAFLRLRAIRSANWRPILILPPCRLGWPRSSRDSQSYRPKSNQTSTVRSKNIVLYRTPGLGNLSSGFNNRAPKAETKLNNRSIKFEPRAPLSFGSLRSGRPEPTRG
jgi:hypothetical protein